MALLPPVSRGRIRRIPLFANLDDALLDAVARASTVSEYAKNAVIFHEETHGSSLFILLQGQVKVALVRPDGKEAILALLHAGDIFGELSLLDNRPRSASVIALAPTTVLTLARDEFLCLIRENPRILNGILVTLATRLRRADQKIADLAFLDAIGRVSGVIEQMAEEQGLPSDGGTVVHNRPSHEQLGHMAGTTRETVTHCLNTLERRGYIRSTGRDLVVYSLDDLRKDFLDAR